MTPAGQGEESALRTLIGAAALVIAAIIGFALAAGHAGAQEPQVEPEAMVVETCAAPDGTQAGAARTVADPSLALYDPLTQTVSYGDADIRLNKMPEGANPDGRYLSSAFIVGNEAIRIAATLNDGVVGIIAARAVTTCADGSLRWFVSNFVEVPAPAPAADDDEAMMDDDTTAPDDDSLDDDATPDDDSLDE